MEFLKYEDIRILQIDPTSHCNLLCPQCARVHNGVLNSELETTSLQEEDYNKIFTEKLVSQLDCVIFNGNYGDPIASHHLEYAIDLLISTGVKKIIINSNGSLRDSEFWSRLGRKLSVIRHLVIFAIDGLEGVNEIYRINSDFDKLMKNVKAFIKSGGQARWDFLIFEHNQHQLGEAEELAKKMGFVSFNKRKTSRFIQGEAYNQKKEVESQRVYNKEQKPVGELKKPSELAKGNNKFEEIIEKYGSWGAYVDATQIKCKYKEEMKAIFIDFKADVWPCTWLAAPKYFYDKNNIQRKDIESVLDRYEDSFNSLRAHSLYEILSHQWFKEDIVDSWSRTQASQNKKLMTCGRTCGEDYEFSSGGRWKNSQITKFRE